MVPELSGAVSDRDSAGFTLTDADGNEYRVLLSEQTFTGVLSASVEDAPAVDGAAQEDAGAEEPAAAEPDKGESVMDESDEDESAMDEPAAQEPVAEEPAGGDEADASQPAPLPTVEWGDGDTVTVYYNGVMTRSIPPQVTALEVLVLRD